MRNYCNYYIKLIKNENYAQEEFILLAQQSVRSITVAIQTKIRVVVARAARFTYIGVFFWSVIALSMLLYRFLFIACTTITDYH